MAPLLDYYARFAFEALLLAKPPRFCWEGGDQSKLSLSGFLPLPSGAVWVLWEVQGLIGKGKGREGKGKGEWCFLIQQ